MRVVDRPTLLAWLADLVLVTSGTGSTALVNGLGNVLVGPHETSTYTGSHGLIAGRTHQCFCRG